MKSSGAMAGWPSWLRQRVHTAKNIGSSPIPATIQLGEDLLVSREFWELEIVGSTPTTETILYFRQDTAKNITNAILGINKKLFIFYSFKRVVEGYNF